MPFVASSTLPLCSRRAAQPGDSPECQPEHHGHSRQRLPVPHRSPRWTLPPHVQQGRWAWWGRSPLPHPGGGPGRWRTPCRPYCPSIPGPASSAERSSPVWRGWRFLSGLSPELCSTGSLVTCSKAPVLITHHYIVLLCTHAGTCGHMRAHSPIFTSEAQMLFHVHLLGTERRLS